MAIPVLFSACRPRLLDSCQYSNMTTLAESFLADLDDLDDASDREQDEQQDEEEADQVSLASRLTHDIT